MKENLQPAHGEMGPFSGAERAASGANSNAVGTPIHSRRGQQIKTPLVTEVGSLIFGALFLLAYLYPVFSKTLGAKLAWASFGVWVIFILPSVISVWNGLRIHFSRIVCISGWVIVVAMNLLLQRGHNESGQFHLIVSVGLFMSAILGFSIGSMSQRLQRAFLATLLCLLGLQAAISLPTLYNENGIARAVMDDSSHEYFQGVLYAARGVGDFNLYTALAVISPVLFGVVLSSSWRIRLILSLFLLAIISSILLSTFSAAVVLAVFGLITVAGGMTMRRGLIGMLLAYLGVIAALSVGLTVLGGLGGVQQVDRVVSKVERLFEGLSEAGIVEGDETTRGLLATLSVSSFLESPLVGVGPVTTRFNPLLYTLIGGHCSWLDQLGEYGILGFGWFIAFFFLLGKDSIGVWRRSRSIFNAGVCLMLFSYAIEGFVNPALFVESISIPTVFLASMCVSAGSRIEE